MQHLNQDGTDAYRFTYYSPAEPSTIHARSISEIPSNGDNLSSMLKKGCFWIDVLSPTDAEMKALSKVSSNSILYGTASWCLRVRHFE